MTNKEFTEAYGELCDAVNVFYEQVATEPTLAARNIMFHRDRLLDSLEEWHRSTTFHPLNREETTMNPIPQEALRRLVQAASEVSTSLSPTPSGKAVHDALEAFLESVDNYRAECKANGDQ